MNNTPNNLPAPTPLSPAAQAIKDAVLALDPDRKTFKWVWYSCRPIAVAALCALADQVASPIPDDCTADVFNRQLDIRAKILAIATELENQP